MRSTEVSEGAPVFGGARRDPHPGAAPFAAPRTRHRRGGLRRCSRDRRFCAFCAISLLPLFIFGQTYSTFPVLLTGYLHVQPADLGLLMSFSWRSSSSSRQYPSVRAVKRLDPMFQVALASTLFGCGVGLSAFVPAAWPLLVTIAALSLAQALFGPVTSAIVARMAPVEIRGRYMGAWTLRLDGGPGRSRADLRRPAAGPPRAARDLRP